MSCERKGGAKRSGPSPHPVEGEYDCSLCAAVGKRMKNPCEIVFANSKDGRRGPGEVTRSVRPLNGRQGAVHYPVRIWSLPASSGWRELNPERALAALLRAISQRHPKGGSHPVAGMDGGIRPAVYGCVHYSCQRSLSSDSTFWKECTVKLMRLYTVF